MLAYLFQDIRFGFRAFRTSPGLSLVAVACLSLGIGANVAVLSWMEGVLFRPFLGVVRQENLVALTGTSRSEDGPTDVSWPDFLDLGRSLKSADVLFADRIMGTTLNIGERAEVASGSIVSANYFEALGVRPVLGRGFLAGEDLGRLSHPVTVISYRLWQSRFHGDPGVIGRTQRLNGVQHTIVGVAPEGFNGTFVGWAMSFWVPASMEELFETGGYKLDDRGARWIEGFIRLKPGVSIGQAQAEISAVADRLQKAYPATNRGCGFTLWPLWQTPFNNAGALLPTLRMMVVVALLVLLIACANVGNLLLARSLARRHEMTVRVAIGAQRGRLVRQLLTEGLVLSGLAGAGGWLVGTWCRSALVLLMPNLSGRQPLLNASFDGRVLAVSATACLVSTFFFGLMPALQASRVDVVAALKANANGVVGGHRSSRLRSALIVTQVALSFLLLVGVGLLLESLQAMRTGNPGFTTTSVLMTQVDLRSAGYDVTRAQNFQQTILERVRTLPGVHDAAFAGTAPFSLRPPSSATVAIDGYVPPPGEQPTLDYAEVSPGYFQTLGIPLIAGRDFSIADGETSASVAIVNETMAARYWRGARALGGRLTIKGRRLLVVGIAKASKYRAIREGPVPFFYVSIRQFSATRAQLFVRSAAPLLATTQAIAGEVRSLDPTLAPYDAISLDELVRRATARQAVALDLLAILSGFALLLATAGLFAVMSYTVSQGLREFGLRKALGESAVRLAGHIFSRGLRLTFVGLLLGSTGGFALTGLMGDLLYKVSPRDPGAFAIAAVLLLLAAAAACALPALKATRTDPMRALRAD
jgi:predicted permease